MQTPAPAEAGAAEDRDRIFQLLVVTTVALLPLPLGIVIWSAPDGAADPNLRVSASPYDIPLLMLIALCLPSMWRRLTARLRRPSSWVAWLGFFATCWFLLATMVHPNWRATELWFHALGGGAIAFLLFTQTRRFLESVTLATAAVAGFQAVLAIAQSLTGDTIGIPSVEASTALWSVGGSYAGRGSFLHPYHLTTFLMLGLASCWVLRRIAPSEATKQAAVVLAAVVGVAIPLTFSRAGILALLVIVPVGLLGRDRRIAAVVLVAVVAGTLLGLSGWKQRGETTADPSRVDSGRSERLSEAAELFESEPFWGVGPGGYGIALEEMQPAKLLPAHNIVAQSGAEAGALGGALTTVGLIGLAAMSVRGGPLGMVVGATIVNFHLLDAFPHVYPNGIVITGIWIGLIGAALRIRRHPEGLDLAASAETVNSPASTPV